MAKGKKKPPTRPQAEPPKAISPLAPKSFAHLPPLAGVRLATGEAGIKYKDRTDVLLAMLAPGTQVGGRLHPIQDRVGAGRMVPRPVEARSGPRPGGQ